MPIYTKEGRLMIPITERKNEPLPKNDNDIRYIINEAYCPNGCSIIDKEVKINGYPGLRMKFKRADCEGEFVISAIEGDFEKKIINGTLKNNVKDELFCPHCGVMFKKLVNCNCQPDADMVVIGLTPILDYNEAITFCNVTGCANGSFIKSGEAIRHVRLRGTI